MTKNITILILWHEIFKKSKIRDSKILKVLKNVKILKSSQSRGNN